MVIHEIRWGTRGYGKHPRATALQKINGFSLSVSAARAAATPSALAPTLSVMSRVSLSVLVMLTLSESR
jgi:hypothetical protein